MKWTRHFSILLFNLTWNKYLLEESCGVSLWHWLGPSWICIVRSKLRWLPDRYALGWVDKGRVRVGGTTMRLPYVKISPSYHLWLNLRVMISRSEETLLTSSTWVAILWEMRNKNVWMHGGVHSWKSRTLPQSWNATSTTKRVIMYMLLCDQGDNASL